MITLLSSNSLPPYHRYEFNPKNGKFQKESSHDDFREAVVGTRGYCQERRVGILRKRQSFAAIYSFNGLLHVWIDQVNFSWPGPFQACRRARLPGMKKFSISTPDEPQEALISFSYAFIDSPHCPAESEVDDIFYKIASKTENSKKISNFIDYWERNARAASYEDVAQLQRCERREGDPTIMLRSNNPYLPDNCYEFDSRTGGYREIPSRDDSSVTSIGIRGLCEEQHIGISKKRQIFAAIYSLGGLLHVWIDGNHFTWPGPFQTRRCALLSRVKRFSISTKVKPRIVKTSFFYIFIDGNHSFPDPQEVDIFYRIAWKTKNSKEIQSFIDQWEANATGSGTWAQYLAALATSKK